MNKVTTNLTLDPRVKKQAILRAKKVGQSLSAFITICIVKELQKKVTLLQHFWSYLEGNVKPKSVLDRNTAEVGQP